MTDKQSLELHKPGNESHFLSSGIIWREKGRRITDTIEDVLISHKLTGDNWTLTNLRDVNVRKSSFQPRNKGKFNENWTDADGVRTNPSRITSPIKEDGYFYLERLGNKYVNCGMSSPYLKFENLNNGISLDVAFLDTTHGIAVTFLDESSLLSDSQFLNLIKFISTPSLIEVATLYDSDWIFLDSDNYPFLPGMMPDSSQLRGIFIDSNSVEFPTMPGYVFSIDRDTGVKSLYHKQSTPKKYILDWLIWHPIAPSLKTRKSTQFIQTEQYSYRKAVADKARNKFKKGKQKRVRKS